MCVWSRSKWKDLPMHGRLGRQGWVQCTGTEVQYSSTMAQHSEYCSIRNFTKLCTPPTAPCPITIPVDSEFHCVPWIQVHALIWSQGSRAKYWPKCHCALEWNICKRISAFVAFKCIAPLIAEIARGQFPWERLFAPQQNWDVVLCTNVLCAPSGAPMCAKVLVKVKWRAATLICHRQVIEGPSRILSQVLLASSLCCWRNPKLTWISNQGFAVTIDCWITRAWALDTSRDTWASWATWTWTPWAIWAIWTP